MSNLVRAFDRYPAYGRSRERLLFWLGKPAARDEIVAAIESDPAIALATLRRANAGGPPARAVCGVAPAVAELGPYELRRVADGLPTFDLLGPSCARGRLAWEFRLHALATLRAVDCLLAEGHGSDPDALRVAALLHDVGKLVLPRDRIGGPGDGTSAERVAAERREWGMDHAALGGVVARRLGLPVAVALLIERHHAADTDGDVAVVRLADLLAHLAAGDHVGPAELVDAASALGLTRDALGALLDDLPAPLRPRRSQPSPLTVQQTAALRLVARGGHSGQIARELGLASSTVRSHLHGAYVRLGVSGRAQAVLVASQNGWV